MYYKLISNNKIVDLLFNPEYVCYIPKKGLERASSEKAQGVFSSDGSTVWHLQGREKMPSIYSTVFMIEISYEEYLSLKKVLEQEKGDQNQIEETPTLTFEEVTLETLREGKLKILKQDCSFKITEGVTVLLSDQQEHTFELTLEDQLNLQSLLEVIRGGAESVIYHEKNGVCKTYSAEDFYLILKAATQHRIYHTTYFNALKQYIGSINRIQDYEQVYYGMEIPEEYQTEALKSLLK